MAEMVESEVREPQTAEREFEEKVVQIRRITKVVKGGKKMGFRATVVVGNRNGEVGSGIAKAAEVSAAIRKAVEKAKKSAIFVPMVGSTLPHEIQVSFGASTVLIKPAKKGTGVIAGGAVRTVLELAGVKDVVSKSLGSNNSVNTTQATILALTKLKEKEDEEEIRGKKLDIKFVGEDEGD